LNISVLELGQFNNHQQTKHWEKPEMWFWLVAIEIIGVNFSEHF
jgi:hypothetical protein